MKSIVKIISMFLALIMSYFVAANPDGFQPKVVEEVTTETTQITIVAENNTRKKLGDPRVVRLEKMVGEEWVEIAKDVDTNEVYATYNPLVTYKHTIHFAQTDLGAETLAEGQYRVVIDYSILEAKGNQSGVAYAEFTVTAA